jgi:putative transposase
MGEEERRRVEPIDEWEQIELLCAWPEPRDYELIRPMALFRSSAAERASETGAASERTLQRKVARFDAEGMESLFASEHAARKKLPPAIRRLVVDLKAEYPRFNLNEIANAVYVRFGRRPDHKTARRILEEEPIPLRFVRRFPPYHEIPVRRDGRTAVVALHAEGWSAKAIAGYLGIARSLAYEILGRWETAGWPGLEDRPPGPRQPARKVDLRAMAAIRRLQANPELGEFRVHAALAQQASTSVRAPAGGSWRSTGRWEPRSRPTPRPASHGRCRSRPPIATTTGRSTCATSKTTRSPTRSRST